MAATPRPWWPAAAAASPVSPVLTSPNPATSSRAFAATPGAAAATISPAGPFAAGAVPAGNPRSAPTTSRNAQGSAAGTSGATSAAQRPAPAAPAAASSAQAPAAAVPAAASSAQSPAASSDGTPNAWAATPATGAGTSAGTGAAAAPGLTDPASAGAASPGAGVVVQGGTVEAGADQAIPVASPDGTTGGAVAVSDPNAGAMAPPASSLAVVVAPAATWGAAPASSTLVSPASAPLAGAVSVPAWSQDPASITPSATVILASSFATNTATLTAAAITATPTPSMTSDISAIPLPTNAPGGTVANTASSASNAPHNSASSPVVLGISIVVPALVIIGMTAVLVTQYRRRHRGPSAFKRPPRHDASDHDSSDAGADLESGSARPHTPSMDFRRLSLPLDELPDLHLVRSAGVHPRATSPPHHQVAPLGMPESPSTSPRKTPTLAMTLAPAQLDALAMHVTVPSSSAVPDALPPLPHPLPPPPHLAPVHLPPLLPRALAPPQMQMQVMDEHVSKRARVEPTRRLSLGHAPSSGSSRARRPLSVPSSPVRSPRRPPVRRPMDAAGIPRLRAPPGTIAPPPPPAPPMSPMARARLSIPRRPSSLAVSMTMASSSSSGSASDEEFGEDEEMERARRYSSVVGTAWMALVPGKGGATVGTGIGKSPSTTGLMHAASGENVSAHRAAV
ncbi:hypothetical protein AMAG_03208 [Allomyces macrogynus ATCC 38327]|uniref:Uncharacterized protein n=1 Tax=Allomyces macrogynus (strain ATCC 38327) TaxID=578462 RepID=A0A0L0S519_ALLM3|nr:hypothetical protein AMAG_03208 [Allomyces macrogynus ATCC 38327]|eukprot:KNE57501.1 hypothetical protein AMAG_03208 [Allomyces macrogynus ATCC 38327]